MKLLKLRACLSALSGGNSELKFSWTSGSHKRPTVMGETAMDGLSDRGSTPLSSIKLSLYIKGFQHL